MIIRVMTDTSAVSRLMRNLKSNQVPFATSVAINDVGKQVQTEERASIRQHFKVRRAQWVDMSVKISHFAKKQVGQNYLVIGIMSPGGRSDILSKFEDGGVKTARDGGSIAIPDMARRSKGDVVLKGQRPRAFNFKLKGSGPNAQVFEGDKGTFMIKRPDGTGGIFQRTAKGIVKTLFLLRPKARIDRRLHFRETARKVVQSKWPDAFRKAWAEALRTAR